MISVIVCSRQPESWDSHQNNVEKTIQCPHEYVRIPNQENQYSICRARSFLFIFFIELGECPAGGTLPPASKLHHGGRQACGFAPAMGTRRPSRRFFDVAVARRVHGSPKRACRQASACHFRVGTETKNASCGFPQRIATTG